MEIVIELAFVDELRVVSTDGLQLYGHLEIGFGVDRLVDFPKSAFINLFDDLEVATHPFQSHLGHQNTAILIIETIEFENF